MFTNFFIVIAVISGITLLWRTFNDDHPMFKRWVQNLPFVGESLSCGVCTSYWLSLVTILIMEPLPGWTPVFLFSFGNYAWVVRVLCIWLATGTVVLFFRSGVIVLLESAAILKHRHIQNHETR